ncbi:17-beta-hydroxysteroid dehydrogenase 14 [Takifugu flavidus]|uniref:17-beta-hydroxysteroid dehydrogenase 14 n=1 Tax=Takifugu flavidus TaxID=433684 RepID=A0A5C6NUU6_9TELE|nr:17-beta-hydroxysteroid dehydrogenase 14 [Takifugu flavidus]
MSLISTRASALEDSEGSVIPSESAALLETSPLQLRLSQNCCQAEIQSSCRSFSPALNSCSSSATNSSNSRFLLIKKLQYVVSDVPEGSRTNCGWNFELKNQFRILKNTFFFITLDMSLRYLSKVAIVTGGSKGIGRGIVKAFGEAGKDLEAELNGAGPGSCTFVSCDVSKEEDIKASPLPRLITTTVETHGRIDCLVNNAGWHPPHQPTDETTAEEFRDLLQLNLLSYFLASKLALPYLRLHQGNIINVSSLVATIGQKHAVPYVATKGAIISMTKAMAVDESVHKVRVNCISPGNVMTPLWEEVAGQSPDAAATIRAGERCQLLGRMGTEAECGRAAIFLAADATFCTGIDLWLSGGAELNYGEKSQISS